MHFETASAGNKPKAGDTPAKINYPWLRLLATKIRHSACESRVLKVLHAQNIAHHMYISPDGRTASFDLRCPGLIGRPRDAERRYNRCKLMSDKTHGISSHSRFYEESDMGLFTKQCFNATLAGAAKTHCSLPESSLERLSALAALHRCYEPRLTLS